MRERERICPDDLKPPPYPREARVVLLLCLCHLQVFLCMAHLISSPDMCSVVIAWRTLRYGQAKPPSLDSLVLTAPVLVFAAAISLQP